MKLTVSNYPTAGDELTASEIVELARVADGAGIDRIGISDAPFHEDCTVMMMACLAATTRLEVESLVTSPYRRAPDAAACSWATLAELSQGRAILGVGRGGGAAETWAAPWGWSRPDGLQAVEEFIDICRAMWAGQTPTLEGKILHTSGRRLDFELRYPVPVLVAARGPKMLRLAARRADIVHIALPFLDMDFMRANVELVLEAAAAAGRPAGEPEIDLTVALSIDEDHEVACQTAKPAAAVGLLWSTNSEQALSSAPRVQDARAKAHDVEVAPDLLGALSNQWNAFSSDPLPADVASMMDDEMIRKFVVYGTPAECGERLRQITDELPGVSGLRLKLPKMPGPTGFADNRRMIELAGQLQDYF